MDWTRQVSRLAVFANGRYNGRTLVEWVPDIVSRLVQHFDPEKIILFGSVARGEAGRDSDVDLLVVLPEVANRRRTGAELRIACQDIPVPMDLIPVGREELAEQALLPGSVVGAALREGKAIYERENT